MVRIYKYSGSLVYQKHTMDTDQLQTNARTRERVQYIEETRLLVCVSRLTIFPTKIYCLLIHFITCDVEIPELDV